MNKYLVSITRYFSGEETKEVEAKNKSDAVSVAKEYFRSFSGCNYDLDSIKCVKKLNTK